MAHGHRSGNRALSAIALAGAMAAATAAGEAWAAGQPLPSAGSADALPSCVTADWLALGRDGASVWLDDADRRAVVTEMHRLYPVMAQDGLPVTRVALWQPRAGALVYVAAIDNPQKPGDACFIATVAADRIAQTPALRRKYLP